MKYGLLSRRLETCGFKRASQSAIKILKGRISAFLVVLALLAACSPDSSAPIEPTVMSSTFDQDPVSVQITPGQPTTFPLPSSSAATATPTLTPPSLIPTTTATNPLESLVDARFAAAMRPSFEGDIAVAAGMPRYDLKLQIVPAVGTLRGSQRVAFSNRTSAVLADVALRLYPNFPRDVFGKGGDVRMDVTGASIGDQASTFDYVAQRTAVVLPLQPPLTPGQSTTVTISFTATIVRSRDGTWPLPAYYPMLAVHDGDGWRLDVTHFADHVYSESALYVAEIHVPTNLQVVASGSTAEVQEQGDGSAIYRVYTGPIREFGLTVGDFTVEQAMADDVAVNVYTARGSHLDAHQISQVAARALADFDRRFGPYPYRELDIHLLPYDYDGGDEYPGLILLYSAGQVGAGTRYVAAHEVAHQWWYGVIGNDIYRQPWLDEAFAQYSAIIYAEDVVGREVAASDWEREVQQRYDGAIADGDLSIGLPITAYPNFNVYYRTVYGKGSVFLRTLREELGDDIFFKALQMYYQRHRYGIAMTEDVQRAFEDASGRDLDSYFRIWV
jgi:hypothetical protein